LEAYGFPHVRRFAIVPSLRQPRWYIPLGSRSSLWRAWDLYEPGTIPGRIGKAGARLLTWLLGACWPGDHVMVGKRQPSDLETALSDAVGHDRIDLAIALPHRHSHQHRVGFLVMSPGGQPLAYAKYGYRPYAASLLEREGSFTHYVRGLHLEKVAVPDVLRHGALGAGYVLIFAPIAPGSRAAGRVLTARHQAVLLELARHAGSEPSAALLSRFSARLKVMAPLLPSDWTTLLTSAADAIVATPGVTELASVLSHGDFVPWNMRTCPDGRLVLFDWERGQRDQFPLWDGFHFLTQVDITLHRASPRASAARSLEQLSRSDMAGILGLSTTQVSALFLAYLADASLQWFESEATRGAWSSGESDISSDQAARSSILTAALATHATLLGSA
jgi:hypothetical protein